MSFASLGLSEALVVAVESAGYTQPTPVQQRAIPAVLQGRDLMVAAQTGTGKTGGFALPILELLFPKGINRELHHQPKQPRVLVLTPTRELAAQVHESFQLYAKNLKLASACVFGGVGINPQVKALAKGLDVLVACPGRLLDLAGQGSVDLSGVEILVLDEADRMLDMGFIHDVKKVLAKLPAERQNLLFSATFSRDIVNLADKLLHNPERIEVTPPNTTVERIEQRMFRVKAPLKRALLAHLITQGAWEQVLIFTRTKHGANRLAEYLDKNGLSAAAIHGNKSQNARTRALADFKENKIRVLVATDIAARGLDIDQLPHVVNFELPNVEEDYVHRIGRTGRAGRAGEAISLVAPDEEKLLKSIERVTRQSIPEGDALNFDFAAAEAERPEPREPRQPRQPRGANKPQGERKARTAKEGERNGERKEKRSPDERGSRNKPRRERSVGEARKATASSPKLPPNRDPEEFLDDEIDNFGNRVDYVSPYQGKGQGRNRRNGSSPAAAAPATRTPRSQSKAQPGTSAARKKPRNASAANGRGRAPQRVIHDAPLREAGEPRMVERAKEKKPLIMHKPSSRDRFPTLEQLEQLNQATRSRTEKPALLTRSRDED